MNDSTPLAPADRLFWELSARYPTRPMVCALYLELAALPDRARLERRLADLAAAHPRLAADLVVERGAPRWRPAPAPAIAWSTDAATAHRDRLTRLAPLLGVPLPDGAPAWSIEVVSSTRTGDLDVASPGLVLRWHHALTDAEGMLDLLTDLTDPVETTDAPAITDRKPTIAGARPRGPRARLRQLARRLRGGPPARAAIGGSRVDYRDLDVALDHHDLRDLAAALGLSTHDVFVGVVARGLHRLGLDGPTTAIHAPISARPRGAPTSLGNHGLPLRLVVDGPREPRDDLATSLRAFGAASAAAIADLVPPPSALLRLVPRLPVRLLERAVLARAPRFLANYLPWSDAPRLLAGAPLLGLHGFAPLLPFRGCTVTAITHAGRVRITLVTDPTLHPDPRPLLDVLRREFAALRDLARG